MFIQRSSLEVDCIHYSFLVPPGYFLHVSIPFSVLFYPSLSLLFSLSLSHTHRLFLFISLPSPSYSIFLYLFLVLSLSFSLSQYVPINFSYFLPLLSLSLHLFPSLFSLLMFCLTISHCLCQSVCLSVVLLMAPTKDLNIYF